MKTKIQILFLLAGISVILASLTGCENKRVVRAHKKPQDTVIAAFSWHGSKQYITSKELEQKISKLPGYRQQNLEKKEKRIGYFNEDIVDERLKFLAAKDAGLHKNSETREKLKEYLHQLMVEKLAKQEVDNKVSVTEDDMKDYHEKNKDKYIEPEKVRLTCITLADKEKAEEVFKQIKRGKGIAKLATELSEVGLNVGPGGRNNGDTGLFGVNSYSWATEFAKAISALKVGQITSQIVVQDVRGVPNYIMFRKEEVKAPRQKTLEDEKVKRDVRDVVESEKRTARMNEWVEEFKAKSNLKIYKDEIQLPADEPEAEKKETTESTEESKKTPEGEESRKPIRKKHL